MQRILLLSAGLALATTLAAQQTITGNGRSGFGGAVGLGTLVLDDDGTDLTGTFTSGSGTLGNVIVIYADTRPGGVASTATLNDQADGGRTATSGAGASGRTVVNFPTGFGADVALVIGSGFTGVFDLANPTNFSYTNSSAFSNDGAGTINFTLPLSALDIQNATTSFVGTLISETAFRSNETLGAATDSDAGSANPGFNAPLTFNSAIVYTGEPVPVRLARFDASATRGAVDLTWVTATERDNAGFAVERSADAATWTELAFVAGFGDSSTERMYDYRDAAPLSGGGYYRLRQVDYDGTVTYSGVVTAAATAPVAAFELVGDYPAREYARVRNGGTAPLDLAVYASSGQRVAAFRVEASATYRLDVSALPSGTYVLRGGRSALPFVRQ